MTDTKILIEALRILARDIQSDDGVANAAIFEAADRLEELTKKLENANNKLADFLDEKELETYMRTKSYWRNRK